MSSQSYYAILGVPVDANQHTLKKAYTKMVLKYNAEKYSGNDKTAIRKLEEIEIAYCILSNNDRRHMYDRTLKEKPRKPSSPVAHTSWTQTPNTICTEEQFDEIFQEYEAEHRSDELLAELHKGTPKGEEYAGRVEETAHYKKVYGRWYFLMDFIKKNNIGTPIVDDEPVCQCSHSNRTYILPSKTKGLTYEEVVNQSKKA